MNKCLTFNPECRPSSEDLLLDPFIVKNTSTVNSQEILKNLVADNMKTINIFRMKLAENVTVQDKQKKKGLSNHRQLTE